MAGASRKTMSINIRAQTSQRDLIDRAAVLSNKTRSDFMLDAACIEAENVLLDQRLFLMDDTTYSAFLEQLEAPLEKNLALKVLLDSKSPWED